MKFFLILLALMISFAGAQLMPNAKPVPTYMADSLGKPLLMDFSIKLEGIKDPNLPFAIFDKRPLMLLYFSPFCPHCQRNYGGIQQIANDYKNAGLESIAVSVGNVSKKDVLMFIEQQEGTMPFFKDSDFKFGKVYGDGYVPRLYLISPDGKVVRYTDLESDHIKDIRADIEKLLGK
ncbi:hypothetical protein AGMMS49938_08660 [Fibrobacterales bacterium]|nr:hypothetical protein AGMMS49938_08660 [Fibrobacterales bacterium]